MRVSIVIPAYNEEKRLPSALKKIKEYLEGKDWESEIIVVDDGSLDKTALLAEKEGAKVLRNEKNMGKGYSVRKGILESRGDFIFFTDADLSTPIEETERFLNWLKNGYDMVIGSRDHPEAKILKRQSWGREKMGKIFNLIVRILFHLPYRDTQCGFKGFRREVAYILFRNLKTMGFAFDVEIILKARTLGFKIKELGVTWINSPQTTVKIFSAPIRMLKEILVLKWGSIIHKN